MSKKMSILKFEPRTRRDLYEMCQYLIDPNKTDYRGLLGFSVNPLQAAKEMEFTQLMYHKEKMWHPYLQIIFSFDRGMELPVDSARMICTEIGKALLPDRRQCLGAIHFKKTNHIHCHYLVNNISIDGELAYTQYHYILEYYDKINAILKKYGMNEISLLYRSRQS